MKKEKDKIVVVDDEYVISKSLSFMLRREGYEVFTASNGEKALELIRAEKPALVILDLDMPVKNGYEVLKEMRGEPPLEGIHVLVLTAKGEPLSGEILKDIGADGYMLKPFDPREVLKYIEAALREVD